MYDGHIGFYRVFYLRRRNVRGRSIFEVEMYAVRYIRDGEACACDTAKFLAAGAAFFEISFTFSTYRHKHMMFYILTRRGKTVCSRTAHTHNRNTNFTNARRTQSRRAARAIGQGRLGWERRWVRVAFTVCARSRILVE